MSAAPAWLIYCRVSTDEQAEEGASLDMQEQACRRYAEMRGYRVADVVRDDGYSATTAKRPGYQRALRDLTSGAAAGIIAWKLKRLHRNTRNWLDLAALSVDRGFGIAVVVDGIDTATPHGRAIATVLATFAQLESEEIGVQTSAAMRYLKGQGYYTGGTVPAGCRVVTVEGGKRRRLVAAEGADVLRQAWGWVTAGASLLEVARRLNEAGVRSAPRRGAAVGRGWTPTSVRTLLLSPQVAGVLVAPELQAQVRAALAERQTPLRGGRPPAPGARAEDPSPLAGLVRCPTCEAGMVQLTCRGNGGAYRYLRCRNRNKGLCRQKDLKAEPIEAEVFDQVAEAFKPGGEYEQQLRARVAAARATLAERQAERARLTGDRDQLSGRVASLTLQGQIGGPAWAEAMRLIGDQLARVDRRLAELAGEIGAGEVTADSIDYLLAEIAKGAARIASLPPAEQAVALRALILAVRVTETEVIIDARDITETPENDAPPGVPGEVRTQIEKWGARAHGVRTVRMRLRRRSPAPPAHRARQGSVGTPPR